ncbi:MAG: recombination regulator RecX [Clostridia bacterium]|nr:recombination regulator RecX [Clostridia bacterium]
MFERKNKAAPSGDKDKAYDAALSFLDARDHGEKELFDKLTRRFTPEAARSAVYRLKENGLVDDERYAREYARRLFERKRLARRGIVAKLRARGITGEVASAAAQELDFDEDEAARELAEELLEPGASQKEKQRVVRRLTSLGYSTGSIIRAINAVEEE